ncbi:MAG: MarR family transcriptional regulator [Proteobacteria bacterium]|nr:MarR family transcriptional regulator [Pseudomonadota bacterium]
MADKFEQWPADVDFGVLGDLIGYAIRRAQIGIYKDFDASVTRLTPPLFAALVLIDANPGINQSRLGQIMGTNRAAMMALLDRLAAMKLVRRVPSASDKRANELQLTDLGQKRLASASAEVAAHDARIAGNLTAAELKTLRHLLKKF